jgi:hypothetical protein
LAELKEAFSIQISYLQSHDIWTWILLKPLANGAAHRLLPHFIWGVCLVRNETILFEMFFSRTIVFLQVIIYLVVHQVGRIGNSKTTS